MFTKILIANRGEIACRVAATARRLGVRTVAVYSDADAHAKHVLACDEAVHVGGSAPRDSYLQWQRIIDAARATGAQAIHPGYGFLSENEDFAQACQDAGLVFIGPPASAINAMGLKAESKRLMEGARRCLNGGIVGQERVQCAEGFGGLTLNRHQFFQKVQRSHHLAAFVGAMLLGHQAAGNFLIGAPGSGCSQIGGFQQEFQRPADVAMCRAAHRFDLFQLLRQSRVKLLELFLNIRPPPIRPAQVFDVTEDQPPGAPIQIEPIQQLPDQPDMPDHQRPVTQANRPQAQTGQRHRLRVPADPGGADQFRTQRGKLARMAALRRLVAEDRPGELPADRLDLVLVALNVQPCRRCGKFRA